VFDIFGNGKAWARDLGGCAHTNEAKLYGLPFVGSFVGIAFKGTAQHETCDKISVRAVSLQPSGNFDPTSSGK
jgi:hypothetical protein